MTLHPIASKHGAGKWREPRHMDNVLRVIRASGLRSYTATSLRFVENGHLISANFRWQTSMAPTSSPQNMGPTSGGSRDIGPTCYGSSGLVACEVSRPHLFNSRRTGTWSVYNFRCATDDPSTTSPPNIGPASVGSRGIWPTCYRSSGLAACQVLWLHLFDSRSTDTWTMPTLGAPSMTHPQNVLQTWGR